MTQSAHPEGLSMLEKRRIEAEILKEVYETLKASHGEEVAKKTIAESVRRSAIEQARAFAAAANWRACSMAERRTDSATVLLATSTPWLAFRVS